MKKLTKDGSSRGGEEWWVKWDWQLMFFFSRNEIECEWWDEITMGGSEWINEYFMLIFFCGGRGLKLGSCIYYELSLPTELSSRG